MTSKTTLTKTLVDLERLLNKPFTTIDQYFSDLDKFASDITISNNLSQNSSNFITINSSSENNTFPFLNDRGTGPISVGLKTLYIFSKIIAGVPASSMRFFNENIQTNLYKDILVATTVEGIQIVLNTIGMLNFNNIVKNFKPELSVSLENICKLIFFKVRDGVFIIDEFKNDTLFASKLVIKAYKEYQKVNQDVSIR